MPRTAKRSARPLQLSAASPPSASEPTVLLDAIPFLPWPVAAAVGGGLAALVGWLLVAGVATLAWFTAISMPLPEVLQFSSRLWLLAHAGVITVGGFQVTLVPLGLSLVGVLLSRWAAAYAAGQAKLARLESPPVMLRLRQAGAVSALTAASYAGVYLVMSLTVGDRATLWRPVLVAFVLSCAGALPSALRGLEIRLADVAPRWVEALVRGARGGVLVGLAGAALVLATAALAGAGRIGAIEKALALDPVGVVVWVVIALAYLPTALLWALSWALGAGFTVGTGSLVSLSGTALGMLPAVPLLGALPPAGVAPAWMLGWLVLGVAAGAVSGVLSVRSLGREPGRLVASLVAAGAGTLTAAVLVLACGAGTGDFGQLRLVDLGPRMPELVVLAIPLIVLSAGAAGTAWWVVEAVRRRRAASVG